MNLLSFLVLGKSNLIEAIAFGLGIPLPRGSYAHVRDLVYKPSSGTGTEGDEASLEQKSAIVQMYVKLNFVNGLVLKRTFMTED